MKHLLLLAACLLFSCKKEPSQTASTGQFELLSPERTGVHFTQIITEEYRYNFSQDANIFNGGGVAVLDVNNDGLQDLFFTSRLQPCKLYLNKGGMKFEDISEQSGITQFIGIKTGVTVADVNADGWQDVYVCRTFLTPIPERRNLLFINNKDLTFSEKGAEFGLDDPSPTQHAVFFDYDLDGDLDCYLVNHPVDYTQINVIENKPGNPPFFQPKDEFESDKLYRNDGGKFVDVSESAGIRNRAWGLSVMANDLNDDGYPDLYIGNDFVMPDFLYINNKNGTFTERNREYFKHISNHTMGIEIADLTNDGLSEIVAVDMLGENWQRRRHQLNTMQLERQRQLLDGGYGNQQMRNVLQLALGNGQYAEIGCLSGMFATEWSWAPLAADFNGDGWKELFITNGVRRDLNDIDFFMYTADSINRTGGIGKDRFATFEDFSKLMPSAKVRNRMFQNTGSLMLQDVTDAWGFSTPSFSNGAAYADLDNDGDLDLVAHNIDDPPFIYENKTNSFPASPASPLPPPREGATPAGSPSLGGGRGEAGKANWLQIRCKGTPANPQGYGAKIWALTGDQMQYQEMTPGHGFYSACEVVFQVGLGKNAEADRVEIEWPGGKHQILEHVKANQRLLLDIADAQPGRLPKAKEEINVFFEETTAPAFTHKENDFEDFNRERLLPHRFSRLGPTIAVGDVNGDGREDFFIGGAAGQAGAVFLQNESGRFIQSKQPALEADARYEDTGSLLFDADGDHDLDLYVASGGNEFSAGDPNYQDRLYLNNGKGFFTKDLNALPAEIASGAIVRAYDLEDDGDLDLFVGGGVHPGYFPQASQRFILRNDGGKFKDIAAALLPEFVNNGMVADLAFADMDKDGVDEMVTCGEWNSITIWNLKKPARFDLPQSSGWWNCLAVNDLDGDGDLDIVAGNVGLNTRFQNPPANNPLRLYAKDFDANGSLDPILCVPENERYLPVSMRDNLIKQLPILKKKFVRNTGYAAADVTTVFSQKELETAQLLETNTLMSAWFENQNGQWIMHPLPDLAQVSWVKRIAVRDFDGNDSPDLLLVGNEYGMEVETGPLDASFGCLLLNDGKGNFKAVPPARSGFWANMDARDLAPVQLANGKSMWLVANNGGRVQAFVARK